MSKKQLTFLNNSIRCKLNRQNSVSEDSSKWHHWLKRFDQEKEKNIVAPFIYQQFIKLWYYAIPTFTRQKNIQKRLFPTSLLNFIY